MKIGLIINTDKSQALVCAQQIVKLLLSEDAEVLLNISVKELIKLSTKNIKIVEEAGIPLVNINGYQIYEGDGYILRGNGKKKIMESFDEDVTKPDEIENLAGRLVDFANTNGYGYYLHLPKLRTRVRAG